jgi:hypothetical protein
MADGSADVNGESEVGRDVDAATDGIIPSQSHRQPRLLEATSRMSTIRRRHVFWSSSHPLWCLLFLDLLSLTQQRAMRPKSRGTGGCAFSSNHRELPSESSTSAFSHASFTDKLQEIMENLIVLHECKDAKHADLLI